MAQPQQPCGKTRLAYIQERTAGIQRLVTSGCPAFATAGYDAGNTEWDFVRVLVVGAGGIGSELLHLLALSGFGELTVIDLDTIELSNLNRQFLFREEDIGSPKAIVAARRVMQRCPGVNVTAVFGRIEEQRDDFYQQFDIIVMGLDSVPARRWMNNKVAELAEWRMVPVVASSCSASSAAAAAAAEEQQQQGGGESASPSTTPTTSTSTAATATIMMMRIVAATPLIDTGTEGLQGHVKVIDMADPLSSCLECQMWMYAVQRKQVPMCTLENIPRAPEHCVLYVQFKLWPDAHSGGENEEPLDGDNVHHIRWVAERARARQLQFRIGGPHIDEVFTLGVVKNVVPAVSFTNAMVSGMAVTEIIKWLTGVAPMLSNYYLYDGAACSTDVAIPGAMFLAAKGDGTGAACSVCGPRPVVRVSLDMTPAEVRRAVVDAAVPHGGSGSDGSNNGRAEALQGTLSLSHAGGQEVFLVFKENSPYAVPIAGATVGGILASSGAGALVASWGSAAAAAGDGGWNEEEEEADDDGSGGTVAAAVTALLTGRGGTTVTVAVQCISPGRGVKRQSL